MLREQLERIQIDKSELLQRVEASTADDTINVQEQVAALQEQLDQVTAEKTKSFEHLVELGKAVKHAEADTQEKVDQVDGLEQTLATLRDSTQHLQQSGTHCCNNLKKRMYPTNNHC